MKIEILNNSSVRIPRKKIESYVSQIYLELEKKVKNRRLTIVFLNPTPAKKLNLRFRNKNYATDVLSFEGEGDSLGELVLCPQVIARQAREHQLLFIEELIYMVLHGILHLLGYDHERGRLQAQRMFRLQDRIFDKLF